VVAYTERVAMAFSLVGGDSFYQEGAAYYDANIETCFWERLAKMNDEEIDTSDIPELDADFFGAPNCVFR
jgi:hypothetical protein